MANVEIVNFPDTKVAVLEHHGDPKSIEESVQRFIEYRKQHHLHPNTNATFNIAYNSPTDVPAHDFRIDLCVATDQPIGDNQHGIVNKTIPGGRCAVLRHFGSDDTLGEAVMRLCAEWFPQSGEIRRDFPMFFQRVKFPPEVSENDCIIDVYLPLQR
jgi:AraC family transcriptional regulator